jgi:hypothetical protein
MIEIAYAVSHLDPKVFILLSELKGVSFYAAAFTGKVAAVTSEAGTADEQSRLKL